MMTPDILTDADFATLRTTSAYAVYEKILNKDADYAVVYKIMNAFISGNYIYALCSNETQDQRVGPSKVEMLVFEVINDQVYYYDDRTVRLLRSFIETIKKNGS